MDKDKYTRESRTIPMSRSRIMSKSRRVKANYLEVSMPGEPVRKFKLTTSAIVIGRGRECDICVPYGNASREHARVVFLNEEYYIEDLNSTNGTHLNDVCISRCLLRSKDIIQVGDAYITFFENDETLI